MNHAKNSIHFIILRLYRTRPGFVIPAERPPYFLGRFELKYLLCISLLLLIQPATRFSFLFFSNSRSSLMNGRYPATSSCYSTSSKHIKLNTAIPASKPPTIYHQTYTNHKKQITNHHRRHVRPLPVLEPLLILLPHIQPPLQPRPLLERLPLPLADPPPRIVLPQRLLRARRRRGLHAPVLRIMQHGGSSGKLRRRRQGGCDGGAECRGVERDDDGE
ncbi:hypothetical protein V8C43DRAFT_41127 [Trichoderma afarasin]